MDNEKDWLKFYEGLLGIDPKLLLSPKDAALVREARRGRERRCRWRWLRANWQRIVRACGGRFARIHPSEGGKR